MDVKFFSLTVREGVKQSAEERGDVRVAWNKLHNEELPNLYCLWRMR
jgi:hypothetical protein